MAGPVPRDTGSLGTATMCPQLLGSPRAAPSRWGGRSSCHVHQAGAGARRVPAISGRTGRKPRRQGEGGTERASVLGPP